MKRLSLVVILISLALSASCSSGSNSASSNANSFSVAKSEDDYSTPSTSTANTSVTAERNGGNKSPVAAQQVSLDQADKSQTATVPVERKIIRNAELTLEADAPDDTQGKINQIAESKGGFVIESQKQSSDTKATKTDVINLTVRVPSAKFDEALAEIRKTASRVILENVKGQDVTEEFIDIEARLKTQKALEAQFLEIMKQAKTVQDALNVQREIAEVRGGIEKIEGRKRFLENQSEFSTLKIRLQAPTAFSASSSGFFYQLGQAFSSGFSAAMSFVLVFVTMIVAMLPFLVFIVLPTYLVIRYFLRKSRRQKLASEIAQSEIKNG